MCVALVGKTVCSGTRDERCGKVVCSGIGEYTEEGSLVCGGVGLRDLRVDEWGGGGSAGVFERLFGGLKRSFPMLKGSRQGIEACSLSSCGVMVL